ncbi:uncharacterized protein LOC142231636 [Haematobia irritans]|uniref:uncharacterized protein LOC142231636 n=1 Tax=Haematobia irritans TaxID=7368 RepID=UPI003F50B1F7
MRSIVILLILAAICQGFEDRCQGSYAREVADYCEKIHGGENVFNRNWASFKYAENESEKCYRSCFFTQCNYFDENGHFADDVPLRVAHIIHGGDDNKVPAISKAVKECFEVLDYKEDRCECSEKLVRCVLEKCSNVGLKLHNIYELNE